MHVAMLGYGSSAWDTFPNPCSGREIQIWGIAKELACRGHEVTLVKAGEADGMITVDGADIVSLKNGLVRNTFQGFQNGSLMNEALSFSRKAAEYLKGLRPDVLCLHYGLSSLHLGDLALPCSYTFHVADVMFSARRGVLQRDFAHYPHAIFTSLMERRSAGRADRLVALNKHMVHHLRHVWNRPSQVIPCGVDETVFKNLGDEGYVLYAGRLDWNKNVEHLVKAYAALPPEVRGRYRLKLVGSGDNEIDVRRLVQRLGLEGQVDMIPWMKREEMASIIGSCSVLVLPSYVETFGIVLIEAMACGKPVLASDIPGPQDVINPGENGLLTRPGDTKDLSSKLKWLLEDPGLRKRMGDRGQSDVEAKYTFRSIGGSYESMLKDLIQETSKNAPFTTTRSFEAASAK